MLAHKTACSILKNKQEGVMEGRTLFIVLYFHGFFCIDRQVLGQKTVTIASYNIWNVMFQWDTRKQYIAEMIKKASPDVIGFQEVRSDAKDQRNQLIELQKLIPQYKHLIYHPVGMVTPPLGLQEPPGWEKEGLGLLSKHPIILSHVVNLTVGKASPDKNKRILIHAQVNVAGDEFDVTVVHLSYDKGQQCENAVDVINYVASMGSERSVLIGDFNAYNDFPWPVNGIMKGSFDKDGSCHPIRYFEPQDSSRGYGFVDAWVTANGDIAGYTFSNMPEPGPVSRPDRILVSVTGLKVISAELLGDGKIYQQKYSFQNKWQRLKTVFRTARETALGPRFKYSCHQDCGPHASCRCGVCVKGGDKNNCELPLCYECDAEHYHSFIFIGLLYTASVIFLMYILLKILITKFVVRTRRSHSRILFLFSNRMSGLAVITLIVSLYFITVASLSDTLETVNGRIPEEMFPSDHMMLVAKLKFSFR